MALVLCGFRFSVYVRMARIVLAEKGLAYEHVEIDPFLPDVPTEYLDLHPFGRVPALVDGGFVLDETGAITRYIDEAFEGSSAPARGEDRPRPLVTTGEPGMPGVSFSPTQESRRIPMSRRTTIGEMAVLRRVQRLDWLDSLIAEDGLLRPLPGGSFRVKEPRLAFA
jgi:hypothetical protein